MRITFLLPADNLTGGARVVAIYAQRLQARGHEVLVVTCAPHRPSFRDKVRDLLRPDSVHLKGNDEPQQGHIALSGVAHKILDRPRAIEGRDLPDADVIVATWWETARWMHGMPSCKGRNVHLIQGYEIWLGQQTIEEVHAALRLPNLKIAISSDLKLTIENALGNLGITVIPNAVDLDQFNAPPRSKRQTPAVGFVYALAPIKGADICIRACELARQQIPELRVMAFGSDQPSSSLPLPKGTEFFYRPPQESLSQIYSSCDTWLFGSRLDSFGLPILEAMACRTPVIAVPVGAAQELLSDGTGTLVAKESPEEMAAAIVHMCRQSADSWQQCSERAYLKAHGYSWDDAVSRFIDILQSATAPA